MCTIEPPPAAACTRATRWAIRNAPRRFVAKIRSQLSSSISRKGFSSAMPALLTRTSILAPALARRGDRGSRPRRSCSRRQCAPRRCLQPLAIPASTSSSGSAPTADQHHLGTLGREPLGDGTPDPLAGSGDDDILLLEPTNGHDAPFTWMPRRRCRGPDDAGRRGRRAITGSEVINRPAIRAG